MAQVPSYYYSDFSSDPQHTMQGSFPMFPEGFMSPYASNRGPLMANTSVVPAFSPNNNNSNHCHMGFSHSNASSPPQGFDRHQLFCNGGQPFAESSLNGASSPLNDGRNDFFRNDHLPSGLRSSTNSSSRSSSSSCNNNQVSSFKTADVNFDKSCSSEELDEPLNDLPLESLLHLTHHEGQLISESEVDDRRALGAPSNLCIPMSQGDDEPVPSSSSFYSSSSNGFYLDTDQDDDDSGSCLSSSTMYSMNSTSDTVVPGQLQQQQTLRNNFDLSPHSSASTTSNPNCISSPYEPTNFSDTSPLPSHSYSNNNNNSNNDNNQISLNSGNTFSNMNCSITNVNLLATSNHMAGSSSSQMAEYPPVVSPDYSTTMDDMDAVGGHFDKYYESSPSGRPDLNNGSPSEPHHHVKKRTKLTKKNSSHHSDQNAPKISKKNVKDISKHNLQHHSHSNHRTTSFSNGVVSPRDESLKALNDIDRCLNDINDNNDDDDGDNSSMDIPSPSNKGLSRTPAAPTTQQNSTRTAPPRKRMRCPRGMTLEIKPCTVCGDNAKNMHFGGLVCDSCKAFFRRSVQSSTWDQFKCEKEETCVITKSNRRSCQYCRFQKCEKVGMQMEWVMTESGRMNLLKNRLRKTRQEQEEKEKEKIYGELPRRLNRDDALGINHILDTLHMTFGSMPYPKECVGDSIDTLSNIFVFLCKRFGKFFLKITEDTDLCQEDKTLLLKNGIAMSLYINGAHMYDPVTRSWPAETTHESVKVPYLTLETLEKLAAIPDAFSTIMKFYENFESDLKDHVVAALMYLISFFLSEDPNFVDIPSIKRVQDEYIGYLKRYLIARDGFKSVNGIFLKLMDGLSYVKDILKFHTLVDIKPTIDHTDLALEAKTSITQSMSNLVHQIQMSLRGNFPPYASVLHEDEKESLGIFNESSALSRALIIRGGVDSVMPNHPDTIAIFGSTTRTDMLITQPLQNMIEWQERNESLAPSPAEATDSKGDYSRDMEEDDNEEEDEDAREERVGRTNRSSSSVNRSILSLSNNHGFHSKRNGGGDREDEMVVGQEEVDVDAVCDILKQLSHTDDVKVFSMLKENIPRELLEKFSRSLSEDEP